MNSKNNPPVKGSQEQLRRRQTEKHKRFVRFAYTVICLELVAIVVIGAIFALRHIGKDAAVGQTAQNSSVADKSSNASVTDSSANETSAESTEEPENNKEKAVPPVSFQVDLSAYEEYMNPADRDAYLLLVNADHPLGADDAPTDLVAVTNSRSDRTEYMREVPEKALQALFLEAAAEGMTYVNPATGQKLSVMSGYRSYERQKSLFATYVSKEMNQQGLSRAQAEAYVLTYSCREGTSEHQTGLCVDMHNLSSADQSFQNQEAAKWLAENAWKFGFILRFPEDKTDVTGISFEPWHFRFVGRYHAYQIYQNGLCLEEYVASLE